MAKLTTQGVKKLAKDKISKSSEGVRWSTLVKAIGDEFPETPVNTIWGSTRSLFIDDPDIVKISKGIYSIKGAVSQDVGASKAEAIQAITVPGLGPVSESDFYQPLADWLRDGLDEVTEAIPIGGNIFKGKWNTPDVIGVLRPLKGDLIKFDPQIVSAEIKIDPSQPVTAFGQAISYRLFSHKC